MNNGPSECHRLTAVFFGFPFFLRILGRFVPVFGQIPPVSAGSGFPPGRSLGFSPRGPTAGQMNTPCLRNMFVLGASLKLQVSARSGQCRFSFFWQFLVPVSASLLRIRCWLVFSSQNQLTVTAVSRETGHSETKSTKRDKPSEWAELYRQSQNFDVSCYFLVCPKVLLRNSGVCCMFSVFLVCSSTLSVYAHVVFSNLLIL